MTDDELLRGFESGELPADQFPHAAHVRVAWNYLKREPLLPALARFRDALQRFSAAKGKPESYHETITVAFVLLIAERMTDAESRSGWEPFAARHPDLLSWTPSVLSHYYTDALLWSDRARREFVMPDKVHR